MTSNGRDTPKLILLTTTDNRAESIANALRMISTLEKFVDSKPAIETHSFVLLQRSSPEAEAELRAKLPAFVTLKTIPERVSLSRARNMLLSAEMAGNLIDRDDVVGFPDDDCWFPDGTLLHITQAFTSRPELDLWFCRYGSDAAFSGAMPEVSPPLQTIISRASSNTMYYRGRVILSVGGFDEKLGVGATYNGGEDTDYALRASYVAREKSFLDAKIVGHRDMFQELKGRYYIGTLIAIWKSAHKSLQGRQALLRKLLVGAALVGQGKMKPGDYWNAISVAREISRTSPT